MTVPMKMLSIEPPCLPKEGDRVSVLSFNGSWEPATITEVDSYWIHGRYDRGGAFAYPICHYREAWRFL